MKSPYSRCGRTTEVYKRGIVVSSNAMNECLINPKTLFTFFTAVDACVCNFSLLSTIRHRSVSCLMVVHSYNKVVDSYLSQCACFYIFPH